MAKTQTKTKGAKKTIAKPAPAKGGATTPAIGEPPAQVQASETEYQRFLPAALGVAAADVRPFKADGSLAYHNIVAGVAAVMAHRAALATQLPHEDFQRFVDLPSLALGTLFAALQVDPSVERTALAADLHEARALRKSLMAWADALATSGVLKQATVDLIKKGKGPLDAANDCVSLAALFNKTPGAVGKTALTQKQIDRAAELGTKLQTILKPGRAKKGSPASAALTRARDVRDRFWTLECMIHERLWSVGTLVFGHAIDEYVPALQGHATKLSADRKSAQAEAAVVKATAKAKKAADVAAKKKGARPSPQG